ncbi:MAG: hypothetical protein U1E53_31870 [Dongiaceae bacterium]
MRPVDGRTLARAATAAVALLALGVAVALWRDAAADPAALWRDPFHDRNSHLRTGLEIALALRHGELAAAFAAATGTLVWPPLHGLLLGLVFLAGGPRLELAILPSLLGWWATILGTWVLAWRSAGPGQPAWMAGLAAAGLALLSPAFRLLGADVMLEGLGAGLSAWALVAGQRCLERPDRPRGRLLGLLLTLLFLEKYNYWLMVAAALGVTVQLSPRLRPPALAAMLALARPAAAAAARAAGAARAGGGRGRAGIACGSDPGAGRPHADPRRSARSCRSATGCCCSASPGGGGAPAAASPCPARCAPCSAGTPCRSRSGCCSPGPSPAWSASSHRASPAAAPMRRGGRSPAAGPASPRASTPPPGWAISPSAWPRSARRRSPGASPARGWSW